MRWDGCKLCLLPRTGEELLYHRLCSQGSCGERREEGKIDVDVPGKRRRRKDGELKPLGVLNHHDLETENEYK